MTVKRNGCQPQAVMNNFCFGVCRSSYIPNDRKVEKVQDVCTATHKVKQHNILTCQKKRKPGMRQKKGESDKSRWLQLFKTLTTKNVQKTTEFCAS